MSQKVSWSGKPPNCVLNNDNGVGRETRSSVEESEKKKRRGHKASCASHTIIV